MSEAGQPTREQSLRAIEGAELPADYPDIGFFEVDRRVFAHHYKTLTPNELGSSNLSIEWYRRNPLIYTVLLSEGRSRTRQAPGYVCF